MGTNSRRFIVPRVLEIVVVGAATIGATIGCAGSPTQQDSSVSDGANADTATADGAACLCTGTCRPEGNDVVCVQPDGRSCSLPSSQCALA